VFLHQGVREANFGSVDGAIAGCFDEGKIVGILRVEDDAIESLLLYIRSKELVETNGTYPHAVHGCVASG